MSRHVKHQISDADRAFLRDFESCELEPGQLRHPEHVRLAYIYSVLNDVDDANARMRTSLRAFLRHHRIDPSKYHETKTRAWMLVVDHFMHRSKGKHSAADFVEANRLLLDKDIMWSHYSPEALGTDEARVRFVEPDREPIPRHGD